MMRIGSLFSGAGGLDLAVQAVFGGEVAWHCENDAAASKVLAARWPGVPNHHDITAVDWAGVEPVDVLCGGWPCQPFSLAGKRKGADDDRALWPYVARAVRMVRPRIVVLENVSAVLGPEFQRVANDLAALRYDIAWTCLRASDVGAPHRRERVFIVATDTSGPAVGESTRGSSTQEARSTTGDRPSDRGGERSTRNGWATPTTRNGRHEGWPEPARLVGRPDATERGDGPLDLLPTPRATRGGSSTETVELLPTPTAQSSRHDADDRGTLDDHNLWCVATRNGLLPTPQARDWKGGQFDINDAVSLLPTPRTSDSNGPGLHGDGGADLRTTVALLQAREMATAWGKYESAIRHWEQVTYPAPAPTEPNRNGNPRLAPAFSEWLMGWPAGHVTQVDGISRNDQLRIIGNGVVPQQAQAAIRWLLSVSEAVA